MLQKSNKGYKGTLFSNTDLLTLVIPLIIEQFLAITVGMSDTIMPERQRCPVFHWWIW